MKNTRMLLLTPLMAGKLKDVILPELIQMLAFGGHTVRIDVTDPDERRGVLKIEDGQVCHCQLGELVGEEAFHALCSAGGVFEVYRTTAGGEQTISRSWQELLLDAARIEDEASRVAERLPSLPLGLSPEDLAARLSEHPRTRTASIFAELLVESGLPSSVPPGTPSRPALVIPPPPALPDDAAWVEEGEFEVLFGEAIYAYLCRQLEESERLFRRCELLRPGDKRVKTNLRRLAERRRGRS